MAKWMVGIRWMEWTARMECTGMLQTRTVAVKAGVYVSKASELVEHWRYQGGDGG